MISTAGVLRILLSYVICLVSKHPLYLSIALRVIMAEQGAQEAIEVL